MKLAYDFGRATFLPFMLPNKFMLRLAGWMALLMTLLYVASFFLAGPVFMDFIAIAEASTTNPNDPSLVGDIFGIYGQLLRRLFFVIILFAVVLVMAETALHKKVQHGIDHGFFPMRLGKIEGKTFVSMLCVFVFVMVAFIIGLIVMMILMAVIVGASGGQSVGATMFAALIGYAVVYGAMIWAGVRFAPAASTTVRDGEIRVFKGLEASKGRFWWMFLSYLVLYVLSLIVTYGLMFLFGAIALSGLPFEELAQSGSTADPSEVMSSILSPGRIVLYFVLGYLFMFITSMVYISIWGVGSYVTNLKAGENPEDTFE